MGTPAIDVMDETFIVAAPQDLVPRLADPAVWRAWWPRLELTVTEDRGPQGLRWSVSGELVGTAEIWFEAWRDGVIVHWYLRADPVPGSRHRPRDPGKIRRAYVTSFKRRIHALKDAAEQGRAPGMPRERREEPPRS